MKIHITGGSGYIGQNILKKLNKNYNISFSDIDNANIENLEEIVKLLKYENPDLIIHLAGLMGAEKSKEQNNLYKTFLVNSFGFMNVLEAARLNDVKNIIFMSSLTVHGAYQNKNQIVDENSSFNPAHPYSTSKVIGEFIARDFAQLTNSKIIILRPTIITGNLNGENNAMNEFVKSANENKPIIIFGSGNHEREYIALSDLINAIDASIKYIELNNDPYLFEEFILSSGKAISMIDLAKKCIELVGNGSIKFVEKNVQSFSLISNIDKAKKFLNWKPKKDVDEMINEIINKLTNK